MNNKKKSKTKTKTNPLYAVTNKGKDVEECNTFLDVLIKKLNLEPVIQVINNIIQMLLEQIKSYAMLVSFNEFFDDFSKRLQAVGIQF